jgi:hypothetical protein
MGHQTVVADSTSLLDLRKAIIDDIAALDIFVKVMGHDGPITAKALPELLAKTPVCLVVCLAVPDPNPRAGVIVTSVSWGLWILTADRGAKGKKDEYALALTNYLLFHLAKDGTDFGVSTEASPRNLSARNLTGFDLLETHGGNLWLVSFDNRARLAIDESDLIDELHQIKIEYDLAEPDGDVDATDEIDTT